MVRNEFIIAVKAQGAQLLLLSCPTRWPRTKLETKNLPQLNISSIRGVIWVLLPNLWRKSAKSIFHLEIPSMCGVVLKSCYFSQLISNRRNICCHAGLYSQLHTSVSPSEGADWVVLGFFSPLSTAIHESHTRFLEQNAGDDSDLQLS